MTLKVVGTTVVKTVFWSPLREVVVIVTELVVADSDTDGDDCAEVLLFCAATAATQRAQRASQDHRIVQERRESDGRRES